jgi:hypothetical protein
MERSELRYIAALVKKAIALLNTGNKMKVAVSTSSATARYERGGICRTPADSAVLRMNVEPWA